MVVPPARSRAAIAGPRHAENTDEPSPNAVPLAQRTASSMFSDGIDRHDRPERLLHRRAVLRHVTSKVADPVAICSVAADIWSISGQLAAWLRGQENFRSWREDGTRSSLVAGQTRSRAPGAQQREAACSRPCRRRRRRGRCQAGARWRKTSCPATPSASMPLPDRRVRALVLSQPGQPALSTRERAGSVSERYLIGDGCVPRSLGHHHELDPDLALRLIEPESARAGRRPVLRYRGWAGRGSGRWAGRRGRRPAHRPPHGRLDQHLLVAGGRGQLQKRPAVTARRAGRRPATVAPRPSRSCCCRVCRAR
jgi:hypothetical protein